MKVLSLICLAACASRLAAQAAPAAVTLQTAGKTRTTSFVADAAVKNVLGGKSEEHPAAGSLGMTHVATHDKFTVLIAVASSMDTVSGSDRKIFGRALLATGSTGIAGPSLSLDYQRYYEYDAGTHQQWGLRAYYSFATTTWRVDSASTTSTSDLSMLSYGVRFVWTPINNVDDEKGNNFAFSIEPGWTFRGLGGDVSEDDAFKRQSLGTVKTLFGGPEASVSLQLRQLQAIASMTMITAAKGTKIAGLTGFQTSVTFRIHAPFLTL